MDFVLFEDPLTIKTYGECGAALNLQSMQVMDWDEIASLLRSGHQITMRLATCLEVVWFATHLTLLKANQQPQPN